MSQCDEAKPVCHNCVRHSLECFYSAPDRTPRGPQADSPRTPSFSFEDFKLLHNWNVSTAESIASNHSLQRAMGEVVPLLAINHQYLMHALLALSSLHMAYVKPAEAERYETLAAHHESLALPLFRSALENVTESNCHALYACGHLVAKYAFANPQSRQTLVFSTSLGTVSEFILLLRGSFSIHNYALEWLSNGPLGFCLEKPLESNPDFSKNPDDAHLARVLSLLLTDSGEDTNVCCGALNTLRRLLAMASTPGQTISTKTLVYCWPAQVPERYIVLVSERNPQALIVLAHYCVMLKMIDSFWFMEGCAVRVLEQCRLNLEDKWQRYIQWPISIMGLEGEDTLDTVH
ncbi:hypothetical protein BX600DRAFT_471619 [Xylariales sp. PMI_506]|nr:hypothetical protein BX600DRAFT_471619 [Xylariales sp. PMI_506]